MQHTTLQHEGAWTFGDSQRTEWYILKNKEIPGPGTHNDRLSKSSTSWTMGNAIRDASFIPPHSNAAIGTYNLNIEFTRPDSKAMSIGNSTRPELPESLTKELDYKPSIRPTRQEAPHYTLGYFESRDYSNGLPAPNKYENGKPNSTVSFNTRENFFTSADRPMPYGEEGKYPGVGKYHLEEKKKDGPHYSIGVGQRPQPNVCPDSPLIFYPIKSTIGAEGKGCSLSDRLNVGAVKNDYPAPNRYYPVQPGRQTKIFSCTSNRSYSSNNASNIISRETARRPAPGNYELAGSLDRGVAFAKSPRPQVRAKRQPGPGAYEIEGAFCTLQGKMGWKLKKPAQDLTPSAQDYDPNLSLTERRTSEVVNLYSNRVDFSKSATRHIGPGEYNLRTKLTNELGKMGRSERPVVRSQTVRLGLIQPGPGQYELPTTIGRIPKYYRNLQRKISEHGQTKIIKYDPNKTALSRLSVPAEGTPVEVQQPKP